MGNRDQPHAKGTDTTARFRIERVQDEPRVGSLSAHTSPPLPSPRPEKVATR